MIRCAGVLLRSREEIDAEEASRREADNGAATGSRTIRNHLTKRPPHCTGVLLSAMLAAIRAA